MSGVTYSECRMPRENDGAAFLLAMTFSGVWAPGPGFCVESKEMETNWWKCGPLQLRSKNVSVILLVNGQNEAGKNGPLDDK